MESKLDEILINQKDLFNHQSSRVPIETISKIETQWKIITILVGLLCSGIGIIGSILIKNI